MASKKDFRGKKPTNASEANAVEAFLEESTEEALAVAVDSSFPAKEQKQRKEAKQEQQEIITSSPAPVTRAKKAEIRNQRLQVVLTPSLLHYLKAAAWYERTSVNNYLCFLLEKAKQEDKKASDKEKEYDGGNK